MFDVAKVVGISMVPLLMDGDLLLFRKRANCLPGDIVLYRVNSDLLLVKRVDGIKNGVISLVSDNQWTESSLNLSDLCANRVVGVVVASLSKRRNFKFQVHPTHRPEL